jgi:FMN-dependent oxidoreductase (nitrilotriacetate monooxygenase family)
MAKHMKLNAFTQCSVNHHSKGQWKHPLTRSADGYRNVHYWIELARTLERGCFDALFLADVHGTYDVYKGSARTAIEQAVQIPGNDPTLVISAMAAATRRLGFACTFSTTYFPPYHTAKLFSTLDHLTEGRVGWNVVTSYLRDALANFGIQDELTHDQRYDRADEYMDVVYKLWEHSWEEDAIVRDQVRDIYIDADRVHRIDHEGEWFSVPGPHQCEPSPQRTPVIYQAGASGRGMTFGVKHAEAIFCVHPTIQVAANHVKSVRAAAVQAGRAADDIKIIQGVAVIVAPTDEEAWLKAEICRGYANREGVLALFCGWSGIDLAALPPGTRLEDCEWNAIQSLKGLFDKIDPDRDWTLEAIGEFMAIGSIFPKIIGSPQTVADELERWMDEADVDGFNVHAVTQPSGFIDFVDLVVPELQRRGRMRTDYDGSTLRENYFGVGHRRLKKTHPAFQALPTWKLGTTARALP